jgi:hypothetical protein
LSPVSAARANGVAWLTGYAAAVRMSLAILVTLLAALVGCKNRELDVMNAVKADVCACKTPSCADEAMGRISKTSIPSTPRTMAIAREILECRAKLEAADRPSTDPDAEGSDSAAPAPAGSAEPGPAASPAPAAPSKPGGSAKP